MSDEQRVHEILKTLEANADEGQTIIEILDRVAPGMPELEPIKESWQKLQDAIDLALSVFED